MFKKINSPKTFLGRLSRAMTKILTHAWMIVNSDMVKHAGNLLAISLVEKLKDKL